MMQKINNLKELQAEKKRVSDYGKALRGAVKNSWYELSSTLQPINLAKELWSKIVHNK